MNERRTKFSLVPALPAMLLLAWLACAKPVQGADLAALCADRTAIEHVYYDHRLGTKPPFEQAMPPDLSTGNLSPLAR